MSQAKLSQQQKTILAWICGLGEAGFVNESGCVPLRLVRKCLTPDIEGEHFPLTRSESASFSRSIRRLEKRGLIMLLYDVTSRHTLDKIFDALVWGQGKTDISKMSSQKNFVGFTKEGMKVATPLVNENIRKTVSILNFRNVNRLAEVKK